MCSLPCGKPHTQRAPSVLAMSRSPSPRPGSRASTTGLMCPHLHWPGPVETVPHKTGQNWPAGKACEFPCIYITEWGFVVPLTQDSKERLNRKPHISQRRPQISTVVAHILSGVCLFWPLVPGQSLTGHSPRLRGNNERLSSIVLSLAQAQAKGLNWS